MYSRVLAALSAAALVAVAAQAQPLHVPPYRKGVTQKGVTGARTDKPNPLRLADIPKILGQAVYGSDHKKIGDVSTVLINPQNHKAGRLVIRSGGADGRGGRFVALPVRDFTWNARASHFTIAQTARQVRHMVQWNGSHPTGATGSGASAPAPSMPSRAGH